MRIRGGEFEFAPPDWVNFIHSRLTGVRTDLPFPSEVNLPLPSGDEDPVDILVDLAELDSFFRTQIQDAVAKLLTQETSNLIKNNSDRAVLLGELCYLAARTGSRQSLPTLQVLAGNETPTMLVAPGEDLRLRALRAFVGLLGTEVDNAARDQYRATLLSALDEPRLAMLGLTGLIGLWPAETESFLQKASERLTTTEMQFGELLEVSLRLAFPAKNPLR